MIGLKDKILRSERLTYRLLEEKDKAPLHRLLLDRSVTEPAGFLPASAPSEFDAFFKSLTQYNTGIAILKDNTLIGYIHVNKYRSDDEEYRNKSCVSTGFVIGKEYQNQGYATETLTAVTEYLKSVFDYCFADHFEGNIPSKRVIEKCGYRYVEEYSLFFDELGRRMTCLSYVY